MKVNFIKLSIFGLAFILLSAVGSAKELKSDELNYSITVPDGWIVDFQSPNGFSITNPDKKRSITLIIGNAKSGMLDSNYVAQFEQVLHKAGVQIVSSKFFTIDGAPAYETVQRIGKASFASVIVDLQIIANNKFYDLGTSVIGGDATQDSEMKKRLASFHFLQPPKLSRFNFLGVKLTVVGIIIVGIIFWAIQRRKT